jgi:hypothetical protein
MVGVALGSGVSGTLGGAIGRVGAGGGGAIGRVGAGGAGSRVEGAVGGV